MTRARLATRLCTHQQQRHRVQHLQLECGLRCRGRAAVQLWVRAHQRDGTAVVRRPGKRPTHGVELLIVQRERCAAVRMVGRDGSDSAAARRRREPEHHVRFLEQHRVVGPSPQSSGGSDENRRRCCASWSRRQRRELPPRSQQPASSPTRFKRTATRRFAQSRMSASAVLGAAVSTLAQRMRAASSAAAACSSAAASIITVGGTLRGIPSVSVHRRQLQRGQHRRLIPRRASDPGGLRLGRGGCAGADANCHAAKLRRLPCRGELASERGAAPHRPLSSVTAIDNMCVDPSSTAAVSADPAFAALLPPITCGVALGWDAFAADTQAILQADVFNAVPMSLIEAGILVAVVSTVCVVVAALVFVCPRSERRDRGCVLCCRGDRACRRAAGQSAADVVRRCAGAGRRTRRAGGRSRIEATAAHFY